MLTLVTWLLLCLATCPAAHACTLFAAVGSAVQGGGVIIAKNRDRTPRASALKVFSPSKGHKFLGLADTDCAEDPAVAGVNERGLAVVDALPSCLASDEDEEVCGAKPLTQTLLSRCASVDEVLAQKQLLAASYPVFEMVADRTKAAWIEVAPGGLVSVKVTRNGTLGHTNHYLDPCLCWANQEASRSSRIRERRIEDLLAAPNSPFNFADFLAISQDRHDGPDRSINRYGSTSRKVRTLATFVVRLSDRPPQVFVRISNPGETDKIIDLTLESALWNKGLREKIL